MSDQTHSENEEQRLRRAQALDVSLESNLAAVEYERAVGNEETATDNPDTDEMIRVEGALKYLHQIRTKIQQLSPNVAPATQGTAFKNQQMGRFEILREVGRGGFATVFLARDPKLDRDVALKIPKPSALMSADAQARFSREAQAAAVLSHPNIVPVYEAGAVGPVEYIASEYCEGPTLAQWFEDQQRCIAPRLAAEIVAALAGAVHHAHQRGVIHRDLKPGNVLVVSPGTTNLRSERSLADRIKITDFGLAHFHSVDTYTTAEGAIVGTPAYMSPEQARGERNTQPSNDIYSLGVILYELLTGQLPHSGDNPIVVLQAIQHQSPPRPQSLNRDIPIDLEAVCLKCLSFEVQERYESAFDVQQDLVDWLSDRPTRARRPSSWKKFRLWRQRNRSLSNALAALILSMMIGLGLTSWKWREANLNFEWATEQREQSQKNLNFAQDMIDELVNDIARNPTIDSSVREEATLKAIQLQERLLHDAPSDERILMGTVQAYRQWFELQIDFHEFGKADEAIRRAQELVLRFPLDSPLRDEMISNVEIQLAKLAALRDKRPTPHDAVPNSEPLSTGERLVVAQRHHVAAGAQRLKSCYQEALDEVRIGLESLDGLERKNPFVADMVGRLVLERAFVLYRMKEYDRAATEAREALTIFKDLANSMGEHEIVQEHFAMTHKLLGRISHARQEWDAADEQLCEARDRYQQLRAQGPKTKRFINHLWEIHVELVNNCDASKNMDGYHLAIDQLFSFYESLAANQQATEFQATLVLLGLEGWQRLDSSHGQTDRSQRLEQIGTALDSWETTDPEEAAKSRQRYRQLLDGR